MQLERISTEALLLDAMPALPQMPQSDFNPIERNPAALQSDALLGQSGVFGDPPRLADFQRNRPQKDVVFWEELKRTLRDLTPVYGIEPRLHFIDFQVKPEAEEEMEAITRRYKGKIREL